jgi:hypothetical protein
VWLRRNNEETASFTEIMKTIVALCSLGLLATAPLSAAPLQRADVPADVLWVAHADCDGLRPTVIGQHLLSEMQKPEAKQKLAAFEAIFHVDLSKQLHGLTLYSAGMQPKDPVLLVYADFDPDQLVALAKAAKDYESTTHNRHVIHNWEDEKKPAKDGVKPRTFAAISGRNIVIFGQQEKTVARALDAIDQTARSLSGTKTFPDLGSPAKGCFIQAATHRLEPDGSQPNAQLFRLAKQMNLQVGEVNREATAKLTLEANDAEVAKSMSSVAQGLISLLKLQEDKPEAVKFANALTLAQDGATVNVGLKMSAEDVVAGMKADAARKEAQKKKD